MRSGFDCTVYFHNEVILSRSTLTLRIKIHLLNNKHSGVFLYIFHYYYFQFNCIIVLTTET